MASRVLKFLIKDMNYSVQNLRNVLMLFKIIFKKTLKDINHTSSKSTLAYQIINQNKKSQFSKCQIWRKFPKILFFTR